MLSPLSKKHKAYFLNLQKISLYYGDVDINFSRSVFMNILANLYEIFFLKENKSTFFSREPSY